MFRRRQEESHIRWAIRRDMPEVLRIENDNFAFPWSEDEFVRCLRQRNCIGMVAELNCDEVVGYMVYELHKTRLHVLNFSVAKKYQGSGIGRQMVDKLKGKLSDQRRQEIRVEVREGNLDAQLFFKRLGFRAVSVIRYFYSDSDEAAYVFSYDVNRPDIDSICEELFA